MYAHEDRSRGDVTFGNVSTCFRVTVLLAREHGVVFWWFSVSVSIASIEAE